MFETASFHIVKPCNMRCKFCYATFEDQHILQQLPFTAAMGILGKLKDAGLEKITFAGGEPFLYKSLKSIIFYAKDIGLTTSIITNGSLISNEWMQQMKGALDWIGISVDSLDKDTNLRSGRYVNGPLSANYYLELAEKIKRNGFRLKINTVVNRYNKNDDLNNFILYCNPDRWKVLRALRVEGQNDSQYEEIAVTEEEYLNFFIRHQKQKNIVPENHEQMTGSYLLIDPQGRLFENSAGKYTYSEPLWHEDVSVKQCLSQLNLNRKMFEARGGIYNW